MIGKNKPLHWSGLVATLLLVLLVGANVPVAPVGAAAPMINCGGFSPPVECVDVSPNANSFTATTGQSVSNRMFSLAVSADGQRLYGGTVSGVWRSDDAGQTWRQLTRPQPPQGTNEVEGALMVRHVFDVVVSPVQKNGKDVLLAATAYDPRVNPKNGIYLSDDGGETWRLVYQFTCSASLGVGQIVFAPDQSNLVYAAGGCKIAISMNGGEKWEEKEIPNRGEVWHLAVARAEGSIRRIYGAGGNQLWYSEDSGANWRLDRSNGPAAVGVEYGYFPSELGGNSSQILAVDPNNPARVYLAVPSSANGPSYYHPSRIGAPGTPCNIPVVYDTNGNAQYDAGDQRIAGTDPKVQATLRGVPITLRHDPKILYFDANDDNVWKPGETVVYDVNGNGTFERVGDGNQDDLIIVGLKPDNGTVLKDDPAIDYVELIFNNQPIPFGPRVGEAGCGEGSVWLGDYSNFNVKEPTQQAAEWTQLPGPPTYYSGCSTPSTPSGRVYIATNKTANDYLLFFADASHVHVSRGLPTSYAAWHRLDGKDASQNQSCNELFVHPDPHAIAFSSNLDMELTPSTQKPPYDRNSELDKCISGTIWMANDGGVYGSVDCGRKGIPDWPLSKGLANIQGIAGFAGLALPGTPPALYFGGADNDNFFSTNGGLTWQNHPVFDCGDCGAWFSDPKLPDRVLEIEGLDRGSILVDITDLENKKAYPDGSNTKDIIVPRSVYPSGFTNGYGGGAINKLGYRPLVLTLEGESLCGGCDTDFILIRFKTDSKGNFIKDTGVLLRTTKLSLVTKATDQSVWDTTATEDGPNTPVFRQGPPLPNGLSAASVVQASGGHNPNSTVFYVGDPTSTKGLWKWTKAEDQKGWQRIVPSTNASEARRFFVDPYDPKLIYILDKDGIKRSDNGGQSWEKDARLDKAVTDNGMFSYEIPFFNANTVGETAVINDMVFDPVERSTRFAIGNAGVFFTVDGRNWTRLLSTTALPGYPVAAYFNRISDPLNRALYVAFNGRGILQLDPIPVPDAADVALTKSAAPNPAIAGRSQVYTLSVTNHGPTSASQVRVVDTLPAGVVHQSNTAGCVETPPGVLTCELGQLLAGETRQIQITVLVEPDVVQNVCRPTVLTNTATVENLGGPDPDPSNNSASVDTPVVPDRATAAFPSTGIRDKFNRQNGPLKNNWYGDARLTGYQVVNRQLDIGSGGPIYWKAGAFGPTLEAYMTFVRVDPADGEQALLLKVQGEGNNPDFRKGAIKVVYDANARVVRVEAIEPGQATWSGCGSFAATVQAGDQFGARAFADGWVELFRNGQPIGAAHAGSFFVNKRGRIGLWFRDAGDAVIDDFGGGTPSR